MCIGSGTKQIARPAPNAGVTVRRCSDQSRGSPRKRLNGCSAQWVRSVSLRGVILRKNPRGIEGTVASRAPRVIGGLMLLAGVLAGWAPRERRHWPRCGSRWASRLPCCCLHCGVAPWPRCLALFLARNVRSRCRPPTNGRHCASRRQAPIRAPAARRCGGERAGACRRRVAFRCRRAADRGPATDAARRARLAWREAPVAPRVGERWRWLVRLAPASEHAQLHRHRHRARGLCAIECT